MSAPGLQGLRPWIIQRISAVFIAVFVVYVALTIIFANPLNENDWANWVAWPGNNIAIGLFLVALLWHAWIGVRDIVLDYIHNVVTRMLILTIFGSIIVGSGFWGIKALYSVFRHW